MFAALLRAASLRVAFLAAVIFLVALSAHVSTDLEDSSFVQSQVIMGSGVRRVEALGADEDLEDDDYGFDDDDTPSLMQAEVSTRQSKSKLQPLDEDEIDDEMGLLQKEASFIQSEATVIEKTTRLGSPGAAEALGDSGDEVSLIQTDATTGCPAGQHCGDDQTSYMQAGVMVQKKTRAIGTETPRKKVVEKKKVVEDEDSIEDETVFFQTGIAVSKGARRVGMGELAGDDDEDELDDGASFIQASVSSVQPGCQASKGEACRSGVVNDEEDEDDEFAL